MRVLVPLGVIKVCDITLKNLGDTVELNVSSLTFVEGDGTSAQICCGAFM